MLDILQSTYKKVNNFSNETNKINKNLNNLNKQLENKQKQITISNHCKCDLDDRCHSPEKRHTRNKPNCNNLNSLSQFLDDGGFPVPEQRGIGYTVANLASKSKKLGEYQFCALSSIAFFDQDAPDEWSEEICRVFQYNGNWYLYVNGKQ